MPGPLSHLRVLDMSRVLAGPWSAQMLADLGADVIKVERPAMGDDSRHWGPPWVADGEGEATSDSAYFTSANRNKRSVGIDIAKPEGQALIRQLAAEVDILVENYKVGDLQRYGLSYEDLKAINPALVYCSITGYGQDGPYADRPGYDFIFQGEGGLMSITGESDDQPGGGPVKVGIAVTDVLAGLNATIAILAAVEHRHRSGVGQHIDIALLDTIVHFSANQVVSYFTSGQVPRRWGNAHPNLAPYQSFKTADGHIIIGCGNDSQFRELCTSIALPDLRDDPRFARVVDRNRNRPELIERLSAVIESQTTSHWLALLEKTNVPNGPINRFDQVFEHPQVRHRELRVEQPHSLGGTVSTVRNPIRLSDTPIEYRHAPPQRAEHTQEVLAEVLGLAPAQIQALAEAGVIETLERRR